MKEKKIAPFIKADKFGYIEDKNGYAFIGFQFPDTKIDNTTELFMGLELKAIKELIVILQDHVERNSK
ncbi:TPA: hypothetical protein ACUNBO_001014 [Morganella morganii]